MPLLTDSLKNHPYPFVVCTSQERCMTYKIWIKHSIFVKMPFTFAHTGYILPVKKKWSSHLSTTGLVFGSLAPDYDILFRFSENRFHLFQYDLFSILFYIYPLALLSVFFFHLTCQSVLSVNLPPVIQKKVSSFLSINIIPEFKSHFIKISFSIILAVFLHLLLDIMCHILDAWSVKTLVLAITGSIQTANIFYGLAIYALPVLFSLYGFYLIWKYLTDGNPIIADFHMTLKQLSFWFLVILLSVGISILKFYIFQLQEDGYLADQLIISLTSSFMLSFYLICFYSYIANRIRKTP